MKINTTVEDARYLRRNKILIKISWKDYEFSKSFDGSFSLNEKELMTEFERIIENLLLN